MITFPLLSFAQLTPGQFNETNYMKISQEGGPNDTDHPDQLYVQVYKYNQDASYTLKKKYLDSACTELHSKAFFKAGVLEGPFVLYAKGLVSLQGSYKEGKWDGERVTYLNGIALQKAYFTNGLNSGTWEEYSPGGNLKRRLTFDSSGKLVTDVKY